jgi:hypothetical protein
MESARRQKRILLFKRKKILTKITFRLKYPNRMCKWVVDVRMCGCADVPVWRMCRCTDADVQMYVNARCGDSSFKTDISVA